MNCTEVSTILDERREQRLTAAEQCAVDGHLAECDDCARAWHAQTTLVHAPIPATPPRLLERALQAHARAAPPRRRALPIAAGVAVLAAGAALAAVISATLSQRAAEVRTPAAVVSPQAAPAPAPAPATPTPAERALVTAPAADVDGPAEPRLPDSDFLPIVREAPFYPPRALEQGREGWVKLQFTITSTGSAKDVVAVASSDAEFETPAVVALSQWKYLPRIVDGRRVASRDVQTIIRFQLVGNPPPQNVTSVVPSAAPNQLDALRFSERIEPAWQCVGNEELRCAELVLDELAATYDLDARQWALIRNFYGYIYMQYGDYGRAIDAFEKAGSWLRVAHLHFEQHQYDMALQAVRRSTEGKKPPWPQETQAFIDKLRALGVGDGEL